MNVFLIAAVTADGFIGRHAQHAADWTSKEDKKRFVHLTKEAGVMVMGSHTFRTIGRALPGRRTIVLTSQPEAITAEGVETTNESPQALVQRLQAEGVHSLAVCGGAQVYTQFMAAHLITDVYITVEPLLFGAGVPLFSSELDTRLTLVDSETFASGAVQLHYRVQ